MNKTKVAILLILISFSCSYNNNKASSKAISCAERAISIGQEYLSGSLDYKKANASINKLQEDMKYVKELSSSDENYTADSCISLEIITLDLSIFNDNFNNTSESYDNVQKSIDALKSSLKKYR